MIDRKLLFKRPKKECVGRKEYIDAISKSMSIDPETVGGVLEELFNYIHKNVAEGKEAVIPYCGRITLSKTKGRVSHSLSSRYDKIYTPAYLKVKFQADHILQNELFNSSAEIPEDVKSGNVGIGASSAVSSRLKVYL